MNKDVSYVLMSVFISLLIISISPALMAKESVSLRLSSFVPPQHFMNKGILEPWIKMIEEKTKGKLKIRLYAGGALGKPQDQYDMVVRGVADIAWGVAAYTPGKFPLTTVMELPFIYPSSEVGSRIIQRLYDEGILKSEYEDVKLLALGMPPGLDLHAKKKLFKTIDDLSGMKVRVNSALMGKLIKKWKKVPVAMPATEVYLSLDRGVIDVIFLDSLTLFGMRLHEVTKYHTVLGLSNTNFWFAMNKKAWNRLSPDVQNVVSEMSGEYLSVELQGKGADKALAGALMKLEKAGHTVYRPSADEKAQWEKASTFIYEEWVDEMAKKGLDGKKVLDAALRIKKAHTK